MPAGNQPHVGSAAGDLFWLSRHLLQFAEMAVPIMAVMFLEVNALIILLMIVSFKPLTQEARQRGAATIQARANAFAQSMVRATEAKSPAATIEILFMGHLLRIDDSSAVQPGNCPTLPPVPSDQWFRMFDALACRREVSRRASPGAAAFWSLSKYTNTFRRCASQAAMVSAQRCRVRAE
jgi:hypothetical protein